jgi:hypothetical protein
MKIFVLTVLTFLIASCNSPERKVSEEKRILKLQIDTLKKANEKLKSAYSALFDKALNLENYDTETAISIYKEIANTKSGNYWTIEAEKRIITLSGKEVKKKNKGFNDNFYWIFSDTLELSQQNEKCGEWGGDIEKIKVYLKLEKLYACYLKETYDCESLENYDKPVPTVYKSREIELTKKQIELLKEVIANLNDYQLNNLSFFGNSGVVNTVRVVGENESFKKLFIQDYPSFNWNMFHKFKNGINN